MPTPKSLEAWAEATPENFRFAIKASQRITHREKLAIPSDALRFMLGLLGRLEAKLGVVLYQLPPFFRRDDARLESFLAALPESPKSALEFRHVSWFADETESPKSALEFRHVSWFADETFRMLEKYGTALCINDNDEFECPKELTAKHTYVRLRRDSYSPEERVAWKERMRAFAARGVDVFAFIKHKDNPDAPLIALDFAAGIEGDPAPIS
jgi:uncharacterized protein YecE (DUF72 family)